MELYFALDIMIFIQYSSLFFRCFHLLSEMKVTSNCYPPGLTVKNDIVNAIKKGVTNW